MKTLAEEKSLEKRKEKLSVFDNIKYIGKEYLKFDKVLMILPIIKIPVTVVDSLLVIYLTRVVLDGLESGEDFLQLAIKIGLITAMMVLLRAVRIRINWAMDYRNYHANVSLFRNAVDDKSADMDYEVFVSPEGKNRFAKAIISVTGNYGSSVSDFYPSIVEFCTNIAGFLTYISIIMMLNPIIILLLLASYSVDSLIAFQIDQWIYKQKEERAKVKQKLDYVLNSSRDTSASKDIRLYQMSDWLYELSKRFGREHVRFEKAANKKRFLQMLLEAAILMVRNGAAYLYLVYVMFHESMTIGEFSMYLAAIMGFGNWLSGMIAQFERVMNSHREVIDYRDFIDMKDPSNRGEGQVREHPAEAVEMEFRDVSFAYPESNQITLEHINVKIKKGEKIAIVGVNGAGKTTFVKLMCGLLQPTKGTILLDGVDLKEYNRDYLYTMVATIFQDICFLPSTIAQNVALCEEEDIDDDRLWKSFELAGIKEKIMSLPEKENTHFVKTVFEDAVELSGGESQKVLLARAIYHNCPLLILDEPTVGIDPILRKKIWDEFYVLKSKGITIIVTTHVMDEAIKCDRLGLIYHGDIIACDAVGTLLARTKNNTIEELFLERGEMA